MTQAIVVGLDGTEQADAAAGWAADEAVLRGTGVRLVHVLEPSPEVLVPLVSREPVESWAQELLARTAAGLRERRPGLAVTTQVLTSGPVPSLVAAADQGDLLVLGSRALGGVAGYLVGSVGMTVAGRVEGPVVLVRADGEGARRGPVVAGVDVQQPADALLRFAFEEAAWRGGAVEVVHVRRLPCTRASAGARRRTRHRRSSARWTTSWSRGGRSSRRWRRTGASCSVPPPRNSYGSRRARRSP